MYPFQCFVDNRVKLVLKAQVCPSMTGYFDQQVWEQPLVVIMGNGCPEK